jgi:hypothetical protein
VKLLHRTVPSDWRSQVGAPQVSVQSIVQVFGSDSEAGGGSIGVGAATIFGSEDGGGGTGAAGCSELAARRPGS